MRVNNLNERRCGFIRVKSPNQIMHSPPLKHHQQILSFTSKEKHRNQIQSQSSESWQANLPNHSNYHHLKDNFVNEHNYINRISIFQNNDPESSSDLSPFECSDLEIKKYDTIKQLTEQELQSGYSRNIISQHSDNKYKIGNQFSSHKFIENHRRYIVGDISESDDQTQKIQYLKRTIREEKWRSNNIKQFYQNPETSDNLINSYKSCDFKKKEVSKPQIKQSVFKKKLQTKVSSSSQSSLSSQRKQTYNMKSINTPIAFQIDMKLNFQQKQTLSQAYQSRKLLVSNHNFIDQFDRKQLKDNKLLKHVKSAPKIISAAAKRKAQQMKKLQIVKRREYAKQLDRVNRMKLRNGYLN